MLAIFVFPVFGVFYPPETYFAPQDFSIDGAVRDIGFPFGRYFTMVVILWIISFSLQHQKLMIRALKRAWLPIVFVVWMVCTAVFTDDFSGSFNRGMRTLVIVVFVAYLVERYSTPQILRLSLIGGTILILASIFAAIALPQYGVTILIGYEGAWRGATTHKNALGGAMATLVLQAYFGARIGALKPLTCLAIGMLAFAVLIMSKSGTALLILVIGMILYMFMQFIMRIRSSSAKMIVISFMLAFIFMLVPLQQYLDEILVLAGRDPTLTGRTEIWSEVWSLIQARPWTGYGNNFWAIDGNLRNEIWITLQWAAPHAHNTFLDIWFQTGIIGICLFAFIIIMSFYQTIRLLFSKHSPYELIWPIIIFTTLIRGFTETQLVEPGSGSWFAFALAMTALAKRLEPEPLQNNNAPIRQSRATL